ncbi:segregation and condensation protein A [Paludibaculum fermentans]|uniref:segregation and condensation protein A n=1 Tax=Paludibaculum fermentans TaxID=1473598 RepID=UPI003EBBC9D2
MSSPLNIHLEHYDGPLDLLLDLIRRQQINIYDIPIAQITQQYLDYVQKAVALDMELSAEFVYMAATLIHIKSKMLLPRDPELDKIDPQEDPRKELVDRLLEYERFRSAAAMLQEKRMIEEAIWSNPQIQNFVNEDEGPGLAVTLFDLVKTFEQVLERAKHRPLYEVNKEEVSVPDMILFLKNSLRALPSGKTMALVPLFEQQRSRRAMICLFLAVLEMVKQQAIKLTQSESFGEIHVKRDTGFDELQVTEESILRIEEEYKS